MTLKIYDGNTWQLQKSLKVYNGSAWSTAKQGWIYNGSAWTLYYPEYPSNSVGPSISINSGTNGAIGCIYAISTGTWLSTDAYVPTSYSYQWTRTGVDISGATGTTYTTTSSDVDKIIGCRVTATNNRGSTSISTSTGTTMLPNLSSVTAYDGTVTPSAPGSVTVNVSNLTYSGSWTAGANATSYEGSTSNGSVTFNYGAQTFTSGTGTSGDVTVSVRSVNTSYLHVAAWSAPAGASSYDIYIDGSYTTNTTNTSYIYSPGNTNTHIITVYPKSPAGTQGYGAQATGIACTAKYSGYTQGSGTLSQPAPANTSIPTLSPTGGYTAGQTLTYGVGSWSNSPTSYDLRLYRGTPGVVMTETLVAAPGNVTSSTYTIPASDYDGTNRYYYRPYASATNAGGTSSYVAGTEGGPLAQPVVIPSGGSVSISTNTGNYSTGSVITYSTSGWAGSPTSYNLRLYNGTNPVLTSDAQRGSTTSSSSTYTITSSDVPNYFKAFATASNSAGTSSEVSSSQVGPAYATVTTTKPTISVSNSFASVSGVSTWTLSMTHTGGSVPTSFDWGIQFSNSNGGTVLASTTGSGTWTAGSGGTQTVTRNSSTYSWARWVSVTATNSAGTSTAQATSWA